MATSPTCSRASSGRPCRCSQAGIEKAKGIEAEKLRAALEMVTIDSIKGHVAMRECDHQAVQGGFMVKVVKKEGFDDPVPEIIATYPGDKTTPACNKDDLRGLRVPPG